MTNAQAQREQRQGKPEPRGSAVTERVEPAAIRFSRADVHEYKTSCRSPVMGEHDPGERMVLPPVKNARHIYLISVILQKLEPDYKAVPLELTGYHPKEWAQVQEKLDVIGLEIDAERTYLAAFLCP
jgi:hypothetical protein